MKAGEIVKRRPAETGAGALGGGALVVVSILEAFGVPVTGVWLKVVAGTVAVVPALFTWLANHGGIVGVIKRISVGDDAPEPGPQPAA